MHALLYNVELQLPEPFSFIFTWFAAVPLIVWLALSLTNVIVKDFLILKVVFVNISSKINRTAL